MFDVLGKNHERTIVCSPRHYKWLVDKFPKKKVVHDSMCSDYWAYYIASNGVIVKIWLGDRMGAK